MNDDQLQFFDLEKPCPESIMNCETLRLQYKKEHEELKRRGGCGGCIERALKHKFFSIISALTVKQ
jgi:hypothetical protein